MKRNASMSFGAPMGILWRSRSLSKSSRQMGMRGKMKMADQDERFMDYATTILSMIEQAWDFHKGEPNVSREHSRRIIAVNLRNMYELGKVETFASIDPKKVGEEEI
jgi:hypothetical protein